MKSIVIIPARLASTRLPRKPLIDLCGKSLVQRVYEGAKQSKLATKVIIATDDQEVVDHVKEFNGEVILSPTNLETGSDRVSWVANKLAKQGETYDIVVNVQGDEPFANGAMVDILIEGLEKDDEAVMSTLKVKCQEDEINNPNCVKVVTTKKNHALYFSRSTIPHEREKTETPLFKHLGYYAFKQAFLNEYANLEQTDLEKRESLEQLRVLENGYTIQVLETKTHTIEINTPEDVEAFEKRYHASITEEK